MQIAPRQATIVHIVSAGVAEERATSLQSLCESSSIPHRHLAVHVGPGASCIPRSRRALRVHTPVPAAWLKEHTLARAIDRLLGGTSDRQAILHVWSTAALGWLGPRVTRGRALVVEADSDDQTRPVPAHVLVGVWSRQRRFVCAHPLTQRRLTQLGAPAGQCVLLEPVVDRAAPEGARRATARSRLALTEDEVAVLALPPVERATGTLMTVWGTLLLEKVRHEVRCIIPRGNAELIRVRELVASCRHDWMVRFAPRDVEVAALIAAADVCAYLPRAAAPLSSVALAHAMGKTLVLTRSAAEALRLSDRVRICRADDPEDAGRQLLRAVEGLRPGAVAGRSPCGRFEPARRIDTYRQIYASLLAE
jgi:hypothetical protein